MMIPKELGLYGQRIFTEMEMATSQTRFYQGSALIINNLVGSSLWHKLACVDLSVGLQSFKEKCLTFSGTICTRHQLLFYCQGMN